MKPARNDPCPCGSGKKYKKCCQAREAAATTANAPAAAGLTQAEFGQLAALFNAGRFVELESAARLLLGRHPQAGFVWKVLAVALQQQGRDALAALQRAAELLPQDVEAQANLAHACNQAGRVDQALAAYRHALALQPGNADLHVLLGNAEAQAGRLAEAVASYRSALAIKPDQAGVISNLGNVLMEAGRFDEAVALYRRAVELQPDYAQAHSNLGNVLVELGQYREAADCCRRAL
ncbi:MAG: tetratricopeptide repeat protein, partial [Gallionella sp.]|nr:tetratricopeptide repeat protein [Gallionella sp.]